MQDKMQEQYRGQKHNQRHEGEVTIEKNRNNRKNNNSDEGEYVDFEEVD